ncbi:MAG TPA: TetR family transcriptional regulator [Rhodospirillaceae bacterium]|nr:TetR family transcriptional regulator [Rhodospirillaceae bacterium]
MTEKSKGNIKEEAVHAALKLVAERGWEQVSLRDIAGALGIGLGELREYVEDKTDILVALGRMIDRKVLEAVGEGDSESSPRDRLFDVLMERYEALNDYREGICAVLDSFLCDPKQAVIGLPHLARSMSWMLEAAGIGTEGVKGAVKVAGLTAIYLKVLKAWKEDESADLSKTMAALDGALGHADRMAGVLGL